MLTFVVSTEMVIICFTISEISIPLRNSALYFYLYKYYNGSDRVIIGRAAHIPPCLQIDCAMLVYNIYIDTNVTNDILYFYTRLIISAIAAVIRKRVTGV